MTTDLIAPPHPAEPLLAEALTFHEAHRFTEADAVYRRLVAEHPAWAPGLWNYARMLHSFPHIKPALKRAAELYSATLKADGNFGDIKAEAWNGLGTIMLGWGHTEKAKECFRRALAMNPNHPHVPTNMGLAYQVAGQLEVAAAHYADVLARNPEEPEAHFESGVICLAMGDLKRGFEEYEWRWKCPQFISARLTTEAPRWNGEELTEGNEGNGVKGKTILLCYEQGLGDAIMFLRYARLIKERWPTAIVHAWVPPEVVRIAECVDGVDRVFCSHETHDEAIDFHCPLLSLPRIFGTTLETVPGEAYINISDCRLPIADWRKGGGALRVGIVWAGRPEHGGDRWRSTDLSQWQDLLRVDGVQWYSFQMGDRRAQLAGAPNVIDLGRNFRDFRDTAEWLLDMDLLISVDTSIVHLAGGMGREVWTLLPFSPDWRWMLETERTPWYPTMRLFRQPCKDAWAPVFERVKEALLQKVAKETKEHANS